MLPKRSLQFVWLKWGSSSSKPLCCSCISLVKDESAMTCNKLLTSVKEELASTFHSFKSLLVDIKTPFVLPCTSSSVSKAVFQLGPLYIVIVWCMAKGLKRMWELSLSLKLNHVLMVIQRMMTSLLQDPYTNCP